MLTGRRDQLHTIKQDGGLAPFPSRAESEYDTFGVGHSSTSISAALGMAVAAAQHGEDRRVVAVIGDGALTAGMAFEALNHAGSLPADLLVILNDNDMSISENVGALSNHFARALSGRVYAHLREGGKKVLRQMPTVWELARRSEEHLKGMVLPGTLFEEMGFNYIGPMDGHDVKALVSTLRNLQEAARPAVPARGHPQGQGLRAGGSRSDQVARARARSIRRAAPSTRRRAPVPSYSQVFGEWLCDMAERDPRIIGITPAMREGSGLVEFSKRFPERYFDVAIAEQHAVTFAAGLATRGPEAGGGDLLDLPAARLRSADPRRGAAEPAGGVRRRPRGPRRQRRRHAPGQLRPVVRALHPQHGDHGAGGRERVPADALHRHHAGRRRRWCAIRAAAAPGVAVQQEMSALPLGKAQLRREGKSGLALLAFGSMVAPAQAIAERLDATLVNMRFVKPLDEDLILGLARRHRAFVTIEENATQGGAGSAIGELLVSEGVPMPLLQLGIPDRFIEHGSREGCLAAAGLDAAGLSASIERWWGLQAPERLRSAGGV